MVATTILTIENASTIADEYLADTFGKTYFAYECSESDDGYHFRVACTREDMPRKVAVGGVTVFRSGDVKTLSEDQIRDMVEAAETQAAQRRKEFARDKDEYVLRYHARIKASIWLSKNVDAKNGASGGVFIPTDPPIWRFIVQDFVLDSEDRPLGMVDVNALTGEVLELDEEEIEIIVRGSCASRRYPQYTATG